MSNHQRFAMSQINPTPQQQAPIGSFVGQAPPNHLVWAILATLFCCLPTGIAAIVYAAQVDGKWAAGDHQGARTSSDKAKFWSWVSLGAGVLFITIYLMLAVFSAALG